MIQVSLKMDIQQLFIKKKLFIKYSTSLFLIILVVQLFSFSGFVRSPLRRNLSNVWKYVFFKNWLLKEIKFMKTIKRFCHEIILLYFIDKFTWTTAVICCYLFMHFVHLIFGLLV